LLSKAEQGPSEESRRDGKVASEDRGEEEEKTPCANRRPLKRIKIKKLRARMHGWAKGIGQKSEPEEKG